MQYQAVYHSSDYTHALYNSVNRPLLERVHKIFKLWNTIQIVLVNKRWMIVANDWNWNLIEPYTCNNLQVFQIITVIHVVRLYTFVRNAIKECGVRKSPMRRMCLQFRSNKCHCFHWISPHLIIYIFKIPVNWNWELSEILFSKICIHD